MSLDPFYHGFHVTCIISYHELAVARGEKPTYPSLKAKRTDWDKLEPQLKKEVCQLHIYKMFLFFVGWYTWFLYPNTSFQEKEEKLDGDASFNKCSCYRYRISTTSISIIRNRTLRFSPCLALSKFLLPTRCLIKCF